MKTAIGGIKDINDSYAVKVVDWPELLQNVATDLIITAYFVQVKMSLLDPIFVMQLEFFNKAIDEKGCEIAWLQLLRLISMFKITRCVYYLRRTVKT